MGWWSQLTKDDPDARMERLDRFDEEQVGLQILIQLLRLNIPWFPWLIIIGHDTTWIIRDYYFMIIWLSSFIIHINQEQWVFHGFPILC